MADIINWYPGHMAKARRLLAEQLSRVDVAVELCDARIPHASRNPDLDQLLAGKTRILVLNKADLADQNATRRWIEKLRAQGIAAYLYDSAGSRSKNNAVSLIRTAAQAAVDKAAQKGVRKTVRAMVVGVTNVGKSTFINRMYGSGIAKTGNRPGVTRANQWVKLGPYLEVMDSPGLLWPRLDDQNAALRLSWVGSISDEVVNLHAVTAKLLEALLERCPDRTAERFKIKDRTLRGQALLDEVSRGRGFLVKGGAYDTDRCCGVVLNEFRTGKLGPVTLELPGEDEPEQAGKRIGIAVEAAEEREAYGADRQN